VERGIDRTGQSLHEQRFGEPGDALEQDMPSNQERDDETIDDPFLPDHRPPYLRSEPGDDLMSGSDISVDGGLVHGWEFIVGALVG